MHRERDRDGDRWTQRGLPRVVSFRLVMRVVAGPFSGVRLVALALIASSILWAGSYARHMALGYDAPKRQVVVVAVDGELALLLGASVSPKREPRGVVAA